MKKKLFKRDNYLSKIRPFYHETDLIKVITGIRRCGKSSIMEMIADELVEGGVNSENIIYIDLDKRGYKSIKTPDELESLIDAMSKGIKGVKYLHGTTYSVIPDQIEAGTFMVAVAATKGDVLIKNVIPKHLESITKKLEKIGVNIQQFDDSIRVWVDGPLVKTNVKTAPHPGFPTDMQSQIATLLTLAEGTSIITENIWEQRFRYVDELRRMGADITVNGKVALIEGKGKLMGAPVKACDLRAGAALIIAGLAASGVTEIEDIFHIERGYDCMEGKLRALGANIEKVSVPDTQSKSDKENGREAV